MLRFEWSETLQSGTLAMHAEILGIPFPSVVLYLVSDKLKNNH